MIRIQETQIKTIVKIKSSSCFLFLCWKTLFKVDIYPLDRGRSISKDLL
jgi:hypothetical protein